MSWHDLSRMMTARSDGDDTRISVQRSAIVIRIAIAVTRKLGWARGDHIAVMVGANAHLGLMRLEKRRPGWKLATTRKGAADNQLKFGRSIYKQQALQDLPDRLSSTPVETTIDGGALEFRLPWCVVAASKSIPARATAVDLEPKPPEARNAAVEGAGSSSEADPAERGGGPATSRPRMPGDAGKAGRAGGSGGSPVPFPVQSRSLAKVEAPSQRRPGPATEASEMWFRSVPPPIPEHILRFLREEVRPVLAPAGWTVTKNREGTGLLLDGHPITLDHLVEKTNRILANIGGELIVAPTMAAE